MVIFTQLPPDIIDNIYIYINKHSNLSLLSMTNNMLSNKSKEFILKYYKHESVIIKSILLKISNMVDDWVFSLIKNKKIKSVEEFKCYLGWNNYDTSHIDFNYNNNKNHEIIEIFYCDCPNCYRTERCGKCGSEFTSDEKKLLSTYFQYDWWNRTYEETSLLLSKFQTKY